MKITLCGSTSFYSQMDEIQIALEKGGLVVSHPRDTAAEYAVELAGLHKNPKHKNDQSEQGRRTKNMLITSHLKAIKQSDAILVVNLEKNGQDNYVGGNTFLEMGFAYAFGKQIYVWNPFNQQSSYYDELTGLLPIIINQDLSAITGSQVS